MPDFSARHILIVDDDDALRDTIAFDFIRKGFKVSTAKSGTIAFSLLEANEIHLVISDLKMPGGNGNSLLEKCRAKLAKPPFFIFVTGWAEVEMKEMLIHKGIDIFPKPYDRKELMACVMKKLGLNP